jgi:hypothetical protein
MCICGLWEIQIYSWVSTLCNQDHIAGCYIKSRGNLTFFFWANCELQAIPDLLKCSGVMNVLCQYVDDNTSAFLPFNLCWPKANPWQEEVTVVHTWGCSNCISEVKIKSERCFHSTDIYCCHDITVSSVYNLTVLWYCNYQNKELP